MVHLIQMKAISQKYQELLDKYGIWWIPVNIFIRVLTLRPIGETTEDFDEEFISNNEDWDIVAEVM